MVRNGLSGQERAHVRSEPAANLKKYVAEFIGTFALVFAGTARSS
jgi:hypothetical protein